MDDDVSGAFFAISNIFNVPQQLNVPVTSLQSRFKQENKSDTVNAANDLLVCLSLKDALTSGVGGLNLSVEDLQNVAAQLLTQQSTEKIASSEETGSHVPLDKQQQCNKQAAINGSSDTPVPRKGAEDLGKYCRKKSGNRPRSAPGDSQTDVPGGTAVPFQELGSAKNSAPSNQVESNQVEELGLLQVESNQVEELGLLQVESNQVEELGLLQVESNQVEELGLLQVESNQSKRRGGWPKGRKRKPELVDMRPPKAPATGYVLYLNEKRKNYKDLPFPEVTKLLGNEWSKLSLEDKRVYLVQAEVEKKRYREELKAYRQSDVYQSYLDRKRNKHLQENGTEESDMDATDEIEDEDNEELYLSHLRPVVQFTTQQEGASVRPTASADNTRTGGLTLLSCVGLVCQGREIWVAIPVGFTESISGEFTKERLAAAEQEGGSSGYSLSTTSLDESSLDGFTPPGVPGGKTRRQETGACPAPDMTDSICRLMTTYSEREREIRSLSSRLEQVRTKNAELMSALGELLAREGRLNAQLETETQLEVTLEQQLLSLWVLPTACLSSANTS
ncbi:unnamed protein product [Timema podura]|uniref:HMG box domain-containing protein n=1 Tax=Timema podura TaxID=61482 RepID=A0ABN7NXH6_TIMPD|nr:unnamed protein product [Timema podura]